ncbi:hypothetical protein PVBG_05772 [Plasmodium vivax Brazil I]|uniref:Uncharacterized protein n=1 Tax=Plasmodium vivax (strain Brazil I) TaxID=1033975 RepID=A0A0J9T0P8_PLAV1|nr:hypothetical protein PVBG_05772 [Plasmodium vivax Brazil I]
MINVRNIIFTLRKKLNYINISKIYVLLIRVNAQIFMKNEEKEKEKEKKKEPLMQMMRLLAPRHQMKCLLNLLPLYGVEFPTLQ